MRRTMLGFLLSWTGGALLVAAGWLLMDGRITLLAASGIAAGSILISWIGYQLLNRDSSDRRIKLRPRRDEWIGPRPY